MAFPLALLLSTIIATAGWQLRALTPGGAVTAGIVGTLILGATGWAGMAALGTFFVGSSVISRLAPDRAADAGESKGSRRDCWQVLANGGAAGVAAVALGKSALPVVTISLAAAAADTWATSFGGWSRTPPRHILSGRPVSSGTSGGVTPLGSVGAAVGAALVGGAAALIGQDWSLFSPALSVGMLGMITDSVLGAVAQGRFHCDRCDQPTERRRHHCGSGTRHTGGLAWLTNDGVNALATGGAAAVGWWLWH